MTADERELLEEARDSISAARTLLVAGHPGYAASRAYYETISKLPWTPRWRLAAWSSGRQRQLARFYAPWPWDEGRKEKNVSRSSHVASIGVASVAHG